jgi:hypothetical protein
MPVNGNNHSEQRRGTRVRAQIPLRITSLDPEVNFSESCHTLLINPQGCGLRCSRALAAGLQLQMDELPGRASVRAKVACSRPLNSEGKYWILGVALETPGNLWCIAPAPEDWGEYSWPAKFLPAGVGRGGPDLFSDILTTNLRAGKA